MLLKRYLKTIDYGSKSENSEKYFSGPHFEVH